MFAGRAHPVLSAEGRRDGGDQSCDITTDGRFLFVTSLKSDRAIIDVTLDWIEEIRAQLKAAPQ